MMTIDEIRELVDNHGPEVAAAIIQANAVQDLTDAILASFKYLVDAIEQHGLVTAT